MKSNVLNSIVEFISKTNEIIVYGIVLVSYKEEDQSNC